MPLEDVIFLLLVMSPEKLKESPVITNAAATGMVVIGFI
jgi:hypothetical protein